MLAFSSKPISKAIEFRYNHRRMTIRVPIDPNNLLYGPKLFTNAENPREVIINRKVAIIEPAENNLNSDFLAGAK
jgi:hypothetical protein